MFYAFGVVVEQELVQLTLLPGIVIHALVNAEKTINRRVKIIGILPTVNGSVLKSTIANTIMEHSQLEKITGTNKDVNTNAKNPVLADMSLLVQPELPQNTQVAKIIGTLCLVFMNAKNQVIADMSNLVQP